MTDNSINSLCEDGQGRLWIGTSRGVIWWKDGVFNRCEAPNGLAGDAINVIYRANERTVWIGAATGLSRYQEGKFTRFGALSGLLSENIRAVYQDGDGIVWIGTAQGLIRLSGDRVKAFTTTNGLPDNSIRGITQDRAGRLWIGSGKGMIWYNTGQFHTYDQTYGLSDNFVTTVCEDRAGNLWVGTYSGLNRFREGRFFNELNREGSAYDRVNAIFEDREGNVWVGSKDGLIRLTPKRFFPYNRFKGLTHNNTMSVLEDRNGGVWTATWGGGLNCLKDERVTAYLKADGLSDDLLLSLAEGRDGGLWIGADLDSGLTRLKDGEFTQFTWKDGLIRGAVRAIHEDRSGNLWVGTGKGLSCLHAGRFTNFTTANQLAGDSVRAICEDAAGNLWIGTDGGLSRWNEGTFSRLTTAEGLSDNAVLAVYADHQNSLWIGTSRGGLNRFRDGRISVYRREQGLFSDEIFEILEDDYGWLWMSCSRGIFRVRKRDLDALDQGDKTSLVSVAYGKTDGMETTLCNGVAKPSAWKAHDGRLWFTTTKGLVAVWPEIPVNETPPPVFIEQVLADKTPILPPSWTRSDAPRGSATAGSTLETSSPIRAPAGQGELEFHFTALNFHKADGIGFRCKLEGVESAWRDVGDQRVVHYNNILPGDYTFRVIARNADGVWNEVGASLALTILPHFWQTWWFKLALALTVVMTLAMAYKLRVGAERKLNRLRLRIARDLHDEVGSNLGSIALLSEVIPKQPNSGGEIAEIRRVAVQTIESLRDIVWFLDPKSDNLPDLILRMKEVSRTMLPGIPFEFQSPALNGAVVPSLEFRRNVFPMFKEILHNIAKHAGASRVEIRIAVEGHRFRLQVSDNGCGFDAARVRAGNGLKNLRRRTAELGGSIEFQSRSEGGSEVTLKADIT